MREATFGWGTNDYIEDKYEMPFMGNKFYSHALVREAIGLGILTKEEIKYEYASSMFIPKDYFNAFIRDVYANAASVQTAKIMINCFIGSLGSRPSASSRTMVRTRSTLTISQRIRAVIRPLWPGLTH